ncbi:MAG: tRNA (N6-threonylcarbamoyladenosine(37)-N6)-methyltransferase TrmO [Bdellovibrionia bacterium]
MLKKSFIPAVHQPWQGSFEAIGTLSTCFKEKFGIPRQPGLVLSSTGVLKLKDHPFFKASVRGLEGFSHLWVIFVFHRHDAKNWKPQIRPPRLGGAKKVGVLASRSPHRPNPIGLSAVKLERIDWEAPGGVELHLSGVDFLDGTPVLDIKPYLPYADSIGDAQSGWAQEPIEKVPVEFSDRARDVLLQLKKTATESPSCDLETLIVQILELDPRPAFQKRKLPSSSPSSFGTCYGFQLLDWDVKWEIQENRFWVREIVLLSG